MTVDSIEILFDRAARAHPQIKLDRAAFRAFVGPLATTEEELAALHAEDLFVACAALEGDARAIGAIEGVLRQIPSFLARRRPARSEIDELTQRARERLFVARDGKPPKLAEYAGRGPLGAWVRVLVTRLFATDRRRSRDHRPLDEAAQAGLVAESPEHLLARARWRGAFDEALRQAFATLSIEHRGLFRLQFAQGLTLDQIAGVLGVHRATAARRIAAAREELWTCLTALLRERLKLRDRELQALLAEWRSQLDVSLSGLLRDPTTA